MVEMSVDRNSTGEHMKARAASNGARFLLSAGTVLAVGTTAATAALQGGSAVTPNLLRNGGAELGPAVGDASGVAKTIPGWVRTGRVTVVKYGSSGGFPDATVSQAILGGKNFFAGGPTNPDSGATQTVNVASRAAAIGAGKMTATLTGDLGGYSSQRDSLTVTASFLDASGQKLGLLKIGPVTPAQRKSGTTLIARSAAGKVPVKTRSIQVALTAVRTDGSYNDGYADNLKLTLTNGPAGA